MTTYRSSSSAFMTNKIPSGARKHREGTKPGTLKTGKMFFFLSSSSSSSDGLAQYCPNLWRWFLHETAAFYTEQCTVLSLFSQLPVLRQSAPRTLWNYMASLGRHFVIVVYACARNRHVATTLQQLSDLRTPERLLRVDVLCQRFVTLLPSYLCCLAAVLTATTNCFTR